MARVCAHPFRAVNQRRSPVSIPVSEKFLSLFEFKIKVPPVIHTKVENFVMGVWAAKCLQAMQKHETTLRSLPANLKQFRDDMLRLSAELEKMLPKLKKGKFFYSSIIGPKYFSNSYMEFSPMDVVVEPGSGEGLGRVDRITISDWGFFSTMKNPKGLAPGKIYSLNATSGLPSQINWRAKGSQKVILDHIRDKANDVMKGLNGDQGEYIDKLAIMGAEKQTFNELARKAGLSPAEFEGLPYDMWVELTRDALEGMRVPLPKGLSDTNPFLFKVEVVDEVDSGSKQATGRWSPYQGRTGFGSLGNLTVGLTGTIPVFGHPGDFQKRVMELKDTVDHELQHMMQTLYTRCIEVTSGKILPFGTTMGMPPRKVANPNLNAYGYVKGTTSAQARHRERIHHSLQDVEFYTNMGSTYTGIKQILGRINPHQRREALRALLAVTGPTAGVEATTRMAFLKQNDPIKWREYARLISAKALEDGVI